jgi:hypothetical protein
MKTRSLFSILFCLVVLTAAGRTFAQTFDISSGGLPTITGSLGGSVTGSSSNLNNLVVTINFGEVSPLNTNNIVDVVVPIAIRSSAAYQVTVTVSGSTNANPQAIQRSDIGFGVNNFRSLGSNARVCNRSSHNFYAPFSNDPSIGVTLDGNGRVKYASSLNNISTSTVILSGPRLSSNNASRQSNNGYAFNAIITLVPQFFAAGSTTQTLTFTISSGPNAPC